MRADFGLSDVPKLLGKDGMGVEVIPRELRRCCRIVLPGTVLKDSDGHFYIPFLSWDSDLGWLLFHSWLIGGWYREDYLVTTND